MIPVLTASAGVVAGECLMLPGIGNLRSKIRHRDRDIANLKTENQALRDQLDQSQNQCGCTTPWSNLLQFPQLNIPYQQQQQPTNQLLNLASQLMQLMGQGMGASSMYSGMYGPQTGSLGNSTGTLQNLFGQLQDQMQLSGGLYNAMNAYESLQRRQSSVDSFRPLDQNGLSSQGILQNTAPGFSQNYVPTYDRPLPPTSTYSQPNDERAIVTTLGKNATKLFPGGKNISMTDIQQIAQGGRCPDGTEAPADLKMACQALASNPALFTKLQSAVKASKGKTDTDGLASVWDVQTLMQQLKAANPNSSTAYNTNTPVRPYSPNSAYGSSFVNALMGHLQSTGVNPYMLNLLQQPGMQQPGMLQPRLAV
ncbi:hypothetical protein [Xylophilus ampelinus]|uniref:Uncharacterized protein n=1 Tax=Xylophilus ampelinus TaxID=54067 RepID=A0A318SGG8_9BURK|nr:hypothetical protein [Xylophilus ampelinus]MCS4510418.1 hypothetical protein [Xylophilus ampelinus]PYE77872.1 hypothetical protein DFQ15_11116 [Xylophilus ampelinus]